MYLNNKTSKADGLPKAGAESRLAGNDIVIQGCSAVVEQCGLVGIGTYNLDAAARNHSLNCELHVPAGNSHRVDTCPL